MLKTLAFYLYKQKSFIPKKNWSVPCTMDSSYFSQKMATWRPNFPHPRLSQILLELFGQRQGYTGQNLSYFNHTWKSLNPKPSMHLCGNMKFSLNNVTIRPTKILNWANKSWSPCRIFSTTKYRESSISTVSICMDFSLVLFLETEK